LVRNIICIFKINNKINNTPKREAITLILVTKSGAMITPLPISKGIGISLYGQLSKFR